MKNSFHKKREKGLRAIAAAVIIGTVLFTVIIDPQLAQYHRVRQTARELKLQLLKMKGNLLLKDKIDASYRQVEALLGNKGTEQQEISSFAGEVSDLYSALDVKIQSVKLLPVNRNETFYSKLSLKMEISGKIDNIILFIFRLESLEKPVKIEHFTLKTQDIVDRVSATFQISKVIANVSLVE